jgi:hypothetical protein
VTNLNIFPTFVIVIQIAMKDQCVVSVWQCDSCVDIPQQFPVAAHSCTTVLVPDRAEADVLKVFVGNPSWYQLSKESVENINNKLETPKCMPTKRVCYYFRLFCVVCHNAESKELKL